MKGCWPAPVARKRASERVFCTIVGQSQDQRKRAGKRAVAGPRLCISGDMERWTGLPMT